MKKYDDLIDIEDFCAFIAEIDEDNFMYDIEVHCTKDLDYAVIEEVLYDNWNSYIIMNISTISINPVDITDVSK